MPQLMPNIFGERTIVAYCDGMKVQQTFPIHLQAVEPWCLGTPPSALRSPRHGLTIYQYHVM